MVASRASDNLLGVVMVASFVKSPLNPLFRLIKPFVGSPLANFRPPKYVLDRLLCAGCSPATARYIQRNMPKLVPEVFWARVRAVMDVDARNELKSLKVPVHYLQATRDKVVKSRSLELIRKVRPDVSVTIIDGPHMILQCEPEQCANALGDWAEICSRDRL
jgi:pimeloyl-ACP methyl ester carboxylesterase